MAEWLYLVGGGCCCVLRKKHWPQTVRFSPVTLYLHISHSTDGEHTNPNVITHTKMSQVPIQIGMPSGVAKLSARGQHLLFEDVVVDLTREMIRQLSVDRLRLPEFQWFPHICFPSGPHTSVSGSVKPVFLFLTWTHYSMLSLFRPHVISQHFSLDL